MIDPELKSELDLINQNLLEIKKKSGKSGIFRAFFSGIFSAVGYVVGLAIIVVIIGWVLQKVGLLAPFEAQVKNFTDLVSSAQKLIPRDQGTSNNQNSKAQNSGGATTVTLPDGK